MCGIIGYINHENSISKTIKSMKKISYRGIDACGIYYDNQIIIAKNPKELQTTIPNQESQITFGHLLHSIIDFIPQPIKQQGTLISNCEIYNWKQLCKSYNIKAKNDSEMLLKLIEKNTPENIIKTLEELDGSFAFAYSNQKQIILARDILGIKPIWYYYKNDKLEFASEKKAINKNAIELDPRQILIYNLKTKQINFIQKEFKFEENYSKENYQTLKQNTQKLLIEAIKKRVPQNQKIGLLFSGGIDSTFIAYTLKLLGIDFTCYTAELKGGNLQQAEDLIYAKEIAKKYNFKLKIASIHINQLEKEVKKVINLIEENEYLKISIAMPFYLACKKAKKDKIKVMFSGLGAEEIFTGYKRHKLAQNVNLECFQGLSILHKRDLYRDDTITMKNNMELRLPLLDKELIKYAMKIPAKYKLNLEQNRNKIILRDIAKDLGLDKKYTERAKKAAQYGSKFDKGLTRLAKNAKMEKQEYLNSL